MRTAASPALSENLRKEGAGQAIQLAVACGLSLLGPVTILSAYWPGVMIDDARWQYQQAVDNAYEDWHPPLMAWVWRHLMLLVEPGPGPMLVLQLFLYWAGIALVGLWLWRRGCPRLAIAAACAGWLPACFALMGSVTKDCLMAGTLCCAVGLMLWSRTAQRQTLRLALGAATILTLLVAAALRVNAFVACVPLALAVLPRAMTSTRLHLSLAALASTAIFFMVPMAVAAALQAEDTDSQLSLIIFDLGGITEHSGVNQFPDLHVVNAVAVNHRCYDPYQWDSYSTWAKRPCPLGFAAFQSLVDEGDVDPRQLWIKSILAHPLAYAQHRLDHFNRSTWFLVGRSPVPTAWTQSVDNPWNFRVQPNALLTAVDRVAESAARTPLGWPVFWIALALATLVVAGSEKLDSAVSAVAASAFLYGMGYLIFGVATGMRYYVWAMTGAALAAILAAGGLQKKREPLDRRALVGALAIVVVPTAMAVSARIFM
jgi:hypothetical protein